MATLWEIIGSMPEATAALSWQRWFWPLGIFNLVDAVCLRKTQSSVVRVPCEKGCACDHRVRQRGAALVGVCGCGEKCPDMWLIAADLEVLEVDLPRLAWGVAYALRPDVVCWLRCDEVATPYGSPRTVHVTALGNPTRPVLLTCQADVSGYRNEVMRLAARLPQGFVLLTPTKLTDASTLELLHKSNARCFDLESNLSLLANANFQVSKEGMELFARLFVENSAPEGKKVVVRASCSFRLAGSMYDIVYDGRRVFHVENTLGAKYLDYLLHHPNEPISCFDLEVAIMPEKGKARDKNSIQKGIDGETVRNYLRELEKLRADRGEVVEDGDQAKVHGLDDEIEAIGKELKKRRQSVDTGEKARGNVSKAISAVRDKLMTRGKYERAFAKHITERVRLGYECIYNNPEGATWQ